MRMWRNPSNEGVGPLSISVIRKSLRTRPRKVCCLPSFRELPGDARRGTRNPAAPMDLPRI